MAQWLKRSPAALPEDPILIPKAYMAGYNYKWFIFSLFGGPPLSSQENTQRRILTYKCLTLTWLVSIQLF